MKTVQILCQVSPSVKRWCTVPEDIQDNAQLLLEMAQEIDRNSYSASMNGLEAMGLHIRARELLRLEGKHVPYWLEVRVP
jgi:hypothetical protein